MTNTERGRSERPGPARIGVTWSAVCWVIAGGMVGTGVRDHLSRAFPAASETYPWTTFAINVTGALALGFLLTALAASGPDEGGRRSARLGLGTGMLGGYTTYSTFMVESVSLAGGGHPTLALAYDAASLAAGFAAALVGVLIGELVPVRGAS